MEYIRVTEENIEKEHICCAISSNRDVQVVSKKAWLTERFRDGLVFLKSAERGKCFIEYIPAEMAWVPIWAEGYMYIDCLWVAGSMKGHGYSSDLLDACIEDSKRKLLARSDGFPLEVLYLRDDDIPQAVSMGTVHPGGGEKEAVSGRPQIPGAQGIPAL